VVYYELQSSSSPIAPDGQCHEREDDLKRKKKKHNVEEASHRSVDEDEGCQSDSGWDERSQLSTKVHTLYITFFHLLLRKRLKNTLKIQ
jgi:hypothetical protein